METTKYLIAKIVFALMCFMMSNLFAASYVMTDEMLFSENFNTAESINKWRKGGNIPEFQKNGGPDGACNALRFIRDTQGDSLLKISLDPEKFKDAMIGFECDIALQDVTAPIFYLGPKFMIVIETGGKKKFLEPVKCTGPFPWSCSWKKIREFYQVPAECKSVELWIGFQSGIGSYSIANIRVCRAREGTAEEANASAIRVITNHIPRGAISGQVTAFRGVMSGNDLSDSALNELKTWNVNFMRYQMLPDKKRAKAMIVEDDYLDWIDYEIEKIDNEILPHAKENGIKIVLDLHYGGRNYTGREEAHFLRNEVVDSDLDCQLLQKTWVKLATHYKGNKSIYGYDLLNEPHPVNPLDTPWPSVAQRLVNVIRNIDTEMPIIVEWFMVNKPFTVEGEHIIYSIHYYSPMCYTHSSIAGHEISWGYPGTINAIYWDKETIRNALSPFIEFQREHKCKIYVGEFSVVCWAPGGAQFLRDCTDLFEEYGWDWTYHAFREWSGWSVEHEGKTRADHHYVGDTNRKKVLLDAYKKNRPSSEEF